MPAHPDPSPTTAAETDALDKKCETEQEQLEAMRAQADEWLVEWADGMDRATTITWLAWYAREQDDDATVTPVTDE